MKGSRVRIAVLSAVLCALGALAWVTWAPRLRARSLQSSYRSHIAVGSALLRSVRAAYLSTGKWPKSADEVREPPDIASAGGLGDAKYDLEGVEGKKATYLLTLDGKSRKILIDGDMTRGQKRPSGPAKPSLAPRAMG